VVAPGVLVPVIAFTEKIACGGKDVNHP